MSETISQKASGSMICGMDVGSTTCKYSLCTVEGEVIAQSYERHNTKQAEKVLEFFGTLESKYGLTPQRDRVFFTGTGAGIIAPLVGGKIIQEVVAVAAAVELKHPNVRFVSEIGGEDMKTIFFSGAGDTKNKQVLMQAACSGGTGTFVEKTARKLQIPSEALSQMRYEGYTLHKISSKCGIFAEADANTLLKAGISVEEIIASLFEAVVYQNLSSLTRGNTPLPEILLLGGPNLFFKGLQEAWRIHLKHIWDERKVAIPEGKTIEELILVPDGALYYGALGCIEVGKHENGNVGIYAGANKLKWWIEEGQHEEKKKSGKKALWETAEELQKFINEYTNNGNEKNVQKKTEVCNAKELKEFVFVAPEIIANDGLNGIENENGNGYAKQGQNGNGVHVKNKMSKVIVGCDFGSTTAKAVCITPDLEIVFSCYALSKGNPIEDARVLFRQIKDAIGDGEILGIGVTGYGKDLLKNIIGADCAVVETIAHATAGLHFFPDADCICDVGGVDVKIMILKNGTVSDFRLNSQCSSGNGAFLQGVAERFNIPLETIANEAFKATAMPQLSMGCGVFLQSDIVNQQRKGWQAQEILASLCNILPLNVWIYAGGLNNLQQVGKKYILQGGTHKNIAVVKAQVDFIRSKIPDAEIVVHPYSGEAGAIGAAFVAKDWADGVGKSQFRGFDVIEKLTYKTTTSLDTVCKWCPVNCQRSFIDVELPGSTGRAWSKVPTPEGWERVIVNNSCPKGLVEDVSEVKVVKTEMERVKNEYPNIADTVRAEAFKRVAA